MQLLKQTKKERNVLMKLKKGQNLNLFLFAPLSEYIRICKFDNNSSFDDKSQMLVCVSNLIAVFLEISNQWEAAKYHEATTEDRTQETWLM